MSVLVLALSSEVIFSFLVVRKEYIVVGVSFKVSPESYVDAFYFILSLICLSLGVIYYIYEY